MILLVFDITRTTRSRTSGATVRAVRRSAIMQLGLVSLSARRSGSVEVEIRWPLERLLDRPPADRAALIDALLGTRQLAALDLAAFAHVRDADLLVRLLCAHWRSGR